jgi:hypothetical protein
MSAISVISSIPVAATLPSLPQAVSVTPDPSATVGSTPTTTAQTAQSVDDATPQQPPTAGGGYTAIASASASTIRGANLNVVT